MKIKKSKHVKRWANYYKIHYDFHYPFKIILDGNFLKICIDREMKLKEYLQKWLKGQIWIYLTSCAMQELNSLGPEFRNLFEEAQQIPKLKCGHIEGLPANDCIKHLIGKSNEKKYWICTQDTELASELRVIPGVPIFYFQQDIKLDLIEPPKDVQKIQEQQEKDKFMPSKQEMKKINPIKQEQMKEEKQKQKKFIENEKRLLGQIIKKKAKAPNPLAVKKKIVKIGENEFQQRKMSDQTEDLQQKKKKRTRVRSKGQRKQQEIDDKNNQQLEQEQN